MGSQTATARETYIDRGEGLDIAQVAGLGTGVQSGQTSTNLFYGSAMTQDNITAHSGGGQGSAFPLNAVPICRVTVVGAAADSVVLPASQNGYEIAVINSAATNSLNVFPAVGEKMNGVLNASAAVAAGTILIFFCVTTGNWYTK
jgi:hypothetical protein